METTDRDKTTPLRKLDSTVVLERFDSSASSCAYLRQESDPQGRETDSKFNDTIRENAATPPPTLVGLDVSIRFGRLSLLMALAVTALTALTIIFNRGVEVGHFDPTTLKDDAAQKRLIDDYNSYTGNVASAFGRPIEIFVALAVHLMLLRVMAASLMRTKISWKTDMFTLAITAGVGFLISNGLNALNVQSQAPEIRPVISAVDLAYVSDLSMADAAARSTNLTQSFSERTPKNPITNTVLRNLVLPRVPAKKPQCSPAGISVIPPVELLDLVLEYGFSQRDWQSRLLQEAVEPRLLRVVVNPSNTTANQAVDADDLPMNVSLAADLFLHSMFVSPFFLRWPRAVDFANKTDINNRYPSGGSDSAARVLGFVPPPDLGRAAQREWFIEKTVAVLTRKLSTTMHTIQSDVIVEFSHVDISPTIHFDALTIEVEVDPMYVADAVSKDNLTRYNDVDRLDQAGPWPKLLMMRKAGLPLGKWSENVTAYEPSAQVQAFGVCVSPSGTEELFFQYVIPDPEDIPSGLGCPDLSNSSLMIVSVGMRFLAESVIENKTANASGMFDSSSHAVVTNLRRIYTFTTAKLSWELSNLADEFNAECAKDGASCKGLRVPLVSTTGNPSHQQELIVGVDALPVNLASQLDYSVERFVPLVQLREPSSTFTNNFPTASIPPLAGDPLLPHNVEDNASMTRHSPLYLSKCNRRIEDRLQLVLNNHMYIEHGLQTAYTAATFFLLQNGVVKDVIELQNNKQSLNFQRNAQRVALLASIPNQNAWLTLGGCALLVLSLCSVLVWAWVTSKATTGRRCGGLGHVTTPHVVARVMLDSVHFPPLFLHRRVIDPSAADGLGEGTSAPTVEGFVIDGLALQPPHGTKEETLAASPA